MFQYLLGVGTAALVVVLIRAQRASVRPLVTVKEDDSRVGAEPLEVSLADDTADSDVPSILDALPVEIGRAHV